MTSGIQAVVFDLYDTLLRIRLRRLHKAVPRLLGVDAARWAALIRDELLTRPFQDRAAFARFICGRLAPRGEGMEERLLALVREEVDSVEPYDGVRALLAFLRRRGFALGLLSNLSSVHKEPLRRHAMEPLFDALGLSCDEGLKKPEPGFYLRLCERLGVPPQAALVVGDSLANDVEAPRALGMRAVRVGDASGQGLKTAAMLGFVSLQPGSELAPLLAEGQRVCLAGRDGILGGLRVLPDSEHGRYNLVASGVVAFDSGAAEDVFCKRYLFPDGAHVEEFAHGLLAALGMPSCHAAVTEGPEPCLLVSRAPGTKLEATATAPLSRQVGRQAALAYLFANADLRPRNAFVSYQGSEPTLTMTDLEHCFLNLALDVSGIEDPLCPESLDRLGEGELGRRVARRVLTPRTMKRARRAFFGTDALPCDLEAAFRDGWMDAYREVQAQDARALGLIEARLRREPFLVVGTQAYRRAMARVDLEDIRGRLEADAEAVYAASFGVDSKAPQGL
ncbi:MAG TPA: HAD family hydrolase [Vicinamibacteria bacterium]|nr:HAD family hydrolase [Vicinamibacteria bacterium]